MAGLLETGRSEAAAQSIAPSAREASTVLTRSDRLGALKVRLGIDRYRYRVETGLYRVGSPDESSPVLVTGNYKLTFDTLRSKLAGVDAWLLVIDTKGINVWCAAGKGTFGTKNVCESVLRADLYSVVNHTTLILPQLAATGVAAHEVQAFTGFRVVYGPARADDIPAFLESGMKTTDEMRRVTFDLHDRFVLTGVELFSGLRPKPLAVMAAIVLASGVGIWGFSWRAVAIRGGLAALAALLGLLGGAFFTPVLLPWLPFRAFSAKGALVGGALGGVVLAIGWETSGAIAAPAAALATVVLASYLGMNFTGSSPIASPSGVEYEMRRAIPWQIAGAAVAVLGWFVSMVI